LRLRRYETDGASTATSAAMRTSNSVSGSRLDASSESAVMLARRSRTGVSLVESAMVVVPFVRGCSQDRDEVMVLGLQLDLAGPPALVGED
jgi:hypothetical protein